MTDFSFSELERVDLVGLEWLQRVTHGDHATIDAIDQNDIAALVMGKALHVKRDVSHMFVNFRHPFGVMIETVNLLQRLGFGAEGCVGVAVCSTGPVLASEIELLGGFCDL